MNKIIKRLYYHPTFDLLVEVVNTKKDSITCVIISPILEEVFIHGPKTDLKYMIYIGRV